MKESRSELDFGSFLVFPSRPLGRRDERWRNVVLGVKHDWVERSGKPRWPDRVAQGLAVRLGSMDLARILAKDAVLVPVPRSGLMKRDSHWPALRICEALRANGIGAGMQELLVRVKGVPPSSQAVQPSKRNTWSQHFDSLEVRDLQFEQAPLVIVDDIITSGAQMLGAARRLGQSCSGALIQAFAVARTMQNTEAIDSIVDPVVGKIVQRGRWTRRTP